MANNKFWPRDWRKIDWNSFKGWKAYEQSRSEIFEKEWMKMANFNAVNEYLRALGLGELIAVMRGMNGGPPFYSGIAPPQLPHTPPAGPRRQLLPRPFSSKGERSVRH